MIFLINFLLFSTLSWSQKPATQSQTSVQSNMSSINSKKSCEVYYKLNNDNFCEAQRFIFEPNDKQSVNQLRNLQKASCLSTLVYTCVPSPQKNSNFILGLKHQLIFPGQCDIYAQYRPYQTNALSDCLAYAKSLENQAKKEKTTSWLGRFVVDGSVGLPKQTTVGLGYSFNEPLGRDAVVTIHPFFQVGTDRDNQYFTGYGLRYFFAYMLSGSAQISYENHKARSDKYAAELGLGFLFVVGTVGLATDGDKDHEARIGLRAVLPLGVLGKVF